MSTAYLFPSTLRGLADVSVSPGSGQNNYPLIWNNTIGKWQANNNIAGITVRAGAGAFSQSIGSNANSTGFGWIAQGLGAGQANSTGFYWIAQGPFAALNSTTGEFFVAQSVYAGKENTTGSFWLSQGYESGAANTVGDRWTAQGYQSANQNTTGRLFVSVGFQAGYYDKRSNVLNIANTQGKSLISGNFVTNCIYLGHAGPITSEFAVPTATAAVHAAASNTTRASLRIDAGVAPTSPFTGDVWMNVSNNSLTLNFPLLNLGNSQILTTRRTGWAAPTGTSTRTTFDTATATTSQLAERLKALIDDLTTHGLIGN